MKIKVGKLMKRAQLVFIVALFIIPMPVQASSNTLPTITEYLANGDYIETILLISDINPLSSIRNGSKTSTYKNSSGVPLWSITVKASFSYTPGKNSKCTSASGFTTAYSSNWKVPSPSVQKSNNTATATVTAKKYSGSTLINSYTRSVVLHCDSYGNLS